MSRKDEPLFTGAILPFAGALRGVARLAKRANEKHNPGQPMHWSRENSNDHADCMARHLVDAFQEQAVSPCGAIIGVALDPETNLPHAYNEVWRALAHAQLVSEWLARQAKQVAECEEKAVVDFPAPSAEHAYRQAAEAAQDMANRQPFLP